MFHVPGQEHSEIVKISVFSSLQYRFDSILIKIPASNFMDINKLFLKFGTAKTQNC